MYKTCKTCGGTGIFTDTSIGRTYCPTCRGKGAVLRMPLGWIVILISCAAWIILGILIIGLELGILHP